MIATEGERELPFLRVISDDPRDGLADARDEPGVLELPDRRVVLGRNLFELVVAVKLDLPAELSQLLWQTCLDEVDGTFVYTQLGLSRRARQYGANCGCFVPLTWPPLCCHRTHVECMAGFGREMLT